MHEVLVGSEVGKVRATLPFYFTRRFLDAPAEASPAWQQEAAAPSGHNTHMGNAAAETVSGKDIGTTGGGNGSGDKGGGGGATEERPARQRRGGGGGSGSDSDASGSGDDVPVVGGRQGGVHAMQQGVHDMRMAAISYIASVL